MKQRMETSEVLDWCRQLYNKTDDDILAVINALASNFNETNATGKALITCAITLQDNADELQAQHELTLQDLNERRYPNTERGQMDHRARTEWEALREVVAS